MVGMDPCHPPSRYCYWRCGVLSLLHGQEDPAGIGGTRLIELKMILK